MPLYAIARTAKQKGGGVAASGHHNDRTRETLNADPEKREQNRILIGDQRNVRELVTEVIEAHGGKPRSDSVEAVEMVLTATRSYFTNNAGKIDQKQVDRFVERAVAFLKDPRSGGVCVKAVMHLDEQTPHVQAHKVPIDPQGKLNCKHYLGSRRKLSAWQDLYHEYMQPLGLERGERGSRARHTDIKDFYAAITRDHRPKLDLDRLPDPPRIALTKEGIRKYKQEIIKSVNEQVAEPLKTLQHQAMLTREEASKREAAEKLAAERVALAEKGAEKAMQMLDKERHENETLRQQSDALSQVNEELKKDVAVERSRTHEQSLLSGQYRNRLKDIPLEDVMERMGYEREQIGNSFVYRDDEQRVQLVIRDQQMQDSQQRTICRNSIDCVLHMRNNNEGWKITQMDAVIWLAENFGEARAVAACVVKIEQDASYLFAERRQNKEWEEKQSGRSELGVPKMGAEWEPEMERAEPAHEYSHEPEDYSFGR